MTLSKALGLRHENQVKGKYSVLRSRPASKIKSIHGLSIYHYSMALPRWKARSFKGKKIPNKIRHMAVNKRWVYIYHGEMDACVASGEKHEDVIPRSRTLSCVGKEGGRKACILVVL